MFLTNRDRKVAEIVAVREKRKPGSKLPGYGIFKDELNLEEGWNSYENRKADTDELMAILNRDDDAAE